MVNIHIVNCKIWGYDSQFFYIKTKTGCPKQPLKNRNRH